MGLTPGQAVPDMSPVKTEVEDPRDGRNGIDRHIMSSSPPPFDGFGSPSKAGPGKSSQAPSSAVAKRDGSFHAGGDGDIEMRSRSTSAAAVARDVAPIQFIADANAKAKAQFTGNAAPREEEDEGDVGGFDLAKGFAPITGMRRPGSVNAR